MPEPHQVAELQRRFNWILLLRGALAIVCGGGVIIGGRVALGWESQELVWLTATPFAVALLLDIPLLLLRRHQPIQRLLVAQLVSDFVLVTAVVYLSGAAESVFTFLYFLILLEAAILHSMGAGLILASLSTIGSTGASILYYLEWARALSIPFGDDLVPRVLGALGQEKFDPRQKILFLVGQMIAFHAVAYLGGVLAERLRRLVLLYDLLLENMPEGILAVDSQERIAFLNPEARGLLGIPADRLVVGEPVRQVIGDAIASGVVDLLLSPEGSNWEITFAGPRGPQPTNLRVAAIRDRKGRMRGAVGVFADLTLRKRLEAAERTAEHLEGLREVSAGIAHEIRNPLASIRGCVQEISRGTLQDEEQAEMAAIIRRESDRLDSILHEFLRFTGMRDPVLGPVDVGKLVDEVVVLLENREGIKTGRVQKAYAGTHIIQGDRGQLEQVFLNLGINALEASGDDRPIRFEIEPTRILGVGSRTVGGQRGQRMLETDAVEVAVHDEGGGMDPSVLQKAFTPFFTTKKGGAGLGLAVVSRIVRGHRGEVVVDNRPGGGCTFRVRLPCEIEAPRKEE